MAIEPRKQESVEGARIQTLIPDPLEGLIEGENRQMRYSNFVRDVLGTIWPPSELSGQQTEYSNYFWGVNRLHSGNMDGYIHFSPNAADPLDLTPHQFEHMVQLVGPEYLRVRAVDPLIAEGVNAVNVGGSCIMETRMMRSAAEMRRAVEEGKIDLSELTAFAMRATEMAPTLTHVSGVQSPTVEYDESGMWAQRISGDYGVPQDVAERMVHETYQRIDSAILKKAHLVYDDPQREMLVVNFDELDLEGEKQRWFADLGLPYDENQRIFDVIATYVGPKVKDQLDQALRRQLLSGQLTPAQVALAQEVLEADYHGRVKQVDHGSFESLPLPIGYILWREKLTREQREKIDEDPIFKAAVVLLRDLNVRHQQKHTEQQGLYVGFADTPGHGATVAHKERSVAGKFTGEPGTEEYRESVAASLNNVAYLHRGNVEEHLAYLSRLTQDETAARGQLIDSKKKVDGLLKPFQDVKRKLVSEANSLQARLAKYDKTIAQQMASQTIFQELLHPKGQEVTEEHLQTIQYIVNYAQKAIDAVNRREEAHETVTPMDIVDRDELTTLIRLMNQATVGKRFPKLPKSLQQRITNLNENTHVLQSEEEHQREQLAPVVATKLAEIEAIETNPGYMALRAERASLEQALDNFKRGPFPLSDNLLVQHAMNLLFDPDSAAYLIRSVQIEQHLNSAREIYFGQIEQLTADITAREENARERREVPSELREAELQEQKRLDDAAKGRIEELKKLEGIARQQAKESMRVLSNQYYPKVAAYMRYIFDESGQIAYPSQMRHSRLVA